MKRLVGSVLALGLLVGAVFLPSLFFNVGSADDAHEPTSIQRYVADFRVDADGTMRATETLHVHFPTGDRHGIFRFWDVHDPNAPNLRRVPRAVRVTLDGRSEPFTTYSEDHGRYRVARIGTEDMVVIPGLHVYEISYVVDDVLVDGADADSSSFYWNLVPGGWRQEIAQADLTVHLPAAVDDVECAVGTGQVGGCTVERRRGATLRVTASDLPARTPVTLRTSVALPVPERHGSALPWGARFDPVLGDSLPALAVVLLLALAAAAWGALQAARTVEPKPSYPLQYAPPEGIGPAQATYVLTEKVEREAYVASIMHAAERGAVDLTRAGDWWTMTDRSGPSGWEKLDSGTVLVARLLGGPGGRFATSPTDVEGGKLLKSEVDAFGQQVRAWARQSGLMVPSGLKGMGGLVVVVAVTITFVLAIWNPFGMTATAMVPGGFAIAAAPLVRTGSGTRRTSSGRDLWARVGGFHRVLSTPSSQDRFDFSGRHELYTAYLPWAVALGCADAWAEKYRTETGAPPPQPRYLVGADAGGTAVPVDSFVDDFSSTLDSAISSYEATQKSSSSGGGGGFSGGGGGGGGGGGSW